MTPPQPTEPLDSPTEVIPPPRPRPRLAPLTIAALALSLVLAIVLVVVIVLALPTGAPIAGPSPIPSITSTPPVTAAQAPPAAAARPDPGRNECVDALGDGTLMDLDSARLVRDDGDLVARFTLAAPIPKGEAALGVTLQSRSGQRVYQLGISWVDGGLDEYFLHDFDKDDQDDLDPRNVDVSGLQVTARFPDDLLKRLGLGWGWSAFATAAGAQLDACPAAPEVLIFDEGDDNDNRGNSGGN